MASPQKEKGFTAIANEILEALAKYRFNGTQRSILDVIFRGTYGFNKKEHGFSISYISTATDIDYRVVQRELKNLIDLKVVIVTKEHSITSERILKFNKNYEQWVTTKKSRGHDKKDVTTKKSSGSRLKSSLPHDQLVTQKRHNINTNNKDNHHQQETPEKFYNNNFGLITPMIAESISYWIDDGVEEALIIELMKHSISMNIRNWAYVDKAIKNNFDINIKTLDQYKAHEIERIAKKQKNKQAEKIQQLEFSNQRSYTSADFEKFYKNSWDE